MRVKWTRDEAILALDVFFSSRNKSFSMNNPEIIELSELLNRLPMVPFSKRSDTFRNIAGVSRQLATLNWGLTNNKKAPIGKIFYEIYHAFRDSPEKLNKIAQAIRRCVGLVGDISFADETEVEGFCEGALLAHLHRYLEIKHGGQLSAEIKRCYICSVKPQQVYHGSAKINNILEAHLLIPPEDYGSEIEPKDKDFIVVCPNCHKVLHNVRPWIEKVNVNSILKTLY